jgi:hypothetical protein
MIGGVRVWCAATAFAIASLAAGCGKTKTLPCMEPIAKACDSASCAMTWDDAQVNTAFCVGLMPLRIDCGAYHAVTFALAGTNRTYYYDIASGMLVAVVDANAVTGSACRAGPEGGFTVPTCSGPASEPLPQCLDGGVADGATD